MNRTAAGVAERGLIIEAQEKVTTSGEALAGVFCLCWTLLKSYSIARRAYVRHISTRPCADKSPPPQEVLIYGTRVHPSPRARTLDVARSRNVRALWLRVRACVRACVLPGPNRERSTRLQQKRQSACGVYSILSTVSRISAAASWPRLAIFRQLIHGPSSSWLWRSWWIVSWALDLCCCCTPSRNMLETLICTMFGNLNVIHEVPLSKHVRRRTPSKGPHSPRDTHTIISLPPISDLAVELNLFVVTHIHGPYFSGSHSSFDRVSVRRQPVPFSCAQ